MLTILNRATRRQHNKRVKHRNKATFQGVPKQIINGKVICHKPKSYLK